jgi:hypothetical protein
VRNGIEGKNSCKVAEQIVALRERLIEDITAEID